MKLGLYIVAVTVTLLGSLSVAPVIFAHFLPSPPALFSDNRRYAPPGDDKPDERPGQLGDPPALNAIAELKLPTPVKVRGTELGKLDPSLRNAKSRQQVIIRLKTPPQISLADQEPGAVLVYQNQAQAEQQAFLERVLDEPNVRLLGQVQLVLNAVFAEVETDSLSRLANDPAVIRIAPVRNYKPALSKTAPYIGASSLHTQGVTGAGVKVAVLDFGIDYTHANLGGPGTPEAYEAAAGTDPSDTRNTTTDGLFPTAKVVGGIDLIGESWSGGDEPLAPDPDPIDFHGHGTHVADIIGGKNGVAPGVELYAVKVCSAIARECPEVALIQGLEFALDPNSDGDLSDRVDIINISLGLDYGQPFDDDLSAAVDNATRLSGVLTVAAAGNAGDKPYVTGTPGAAETALSVAETHVPSDFLLMNVLQPASDAGNYETVFQPWTAPLSGVIEGPVQYGNGAGGNLDGCAQFPAESLAGKLVLVDWGGCPFSDKVHNIQDAGGILALIGLISPGDPFVGSFGGGAPITTIPSFIVSQASANILRTGSAVVRFDPNNVISRAGSMTNTSSRGPELNDHLIKPEIGAPGASVSAVAGTGTDQALFGGTSGAAPMVSGAAALVLQAHPALPGESLSPLEVKALLMNNADIQILSGPGGALAPISRIGGGELRAQRAVDAPAAAWDEDHSTGALSFGFVDVTDSDVSITKEVHLRNYSEEDITYQVTSIMRSDDDADNGAVTVSAPSTAQVEAGQDTVFEVTLTIDGAKLRDNLMSSGAEGNNAAFLTINEYDGYLTLDDNQHPIHLAWHVLPRKAAEVSADRTILDFDDGFSNSIKLTNSGVGTAQINTYSLIALSPDLPRGERGQQSPTPDIRAIGVQTIPVEAGFCSENPSYLLSFAVNSWERQTHANVPGSYRFNLDTNRDGAPEFAVFNRDLGSPGPIDGRNVTWVRDYSTYDDTAVFFTEHATNSANTVLHVCAEQIGNPPFFQTINVTAFADDILFGGPGDQVEGLTFAPGSERYLTTPISDIPSGVTGEMPVVDLAAFNRFPTNSGELGVLMFTNASRGKLTLKQFPESDTEVYPVSPAVNIPKQGGATADTEAIIFLNSEE